MHHAFDDLEKTQGDRCRCPLCDARRGLSYDRDEGETGVWHCFSCCEGGTGAELYAVMYGVPIAEALDVFGISQSELNRDVKRKERSRPIPSVDHSDEEWERRCRIWKQMTDLELELLELARQMNAWAKDDRDSERFYSWVEHIEWLYDEVEGRVADELRIDQEQKAKWTFQRQQ